VEDDRTPEHSCLAPRRVSQAGDICRPLRSLRPSAAPSASAGRDSASASATCSGSDPNLTQIRSEAPRGSAMRRKPFAGAKPSDGLEPFVGLCPTTRARPPSASASSRRPSAAPKAAESSATSSGSVLRTPSSSPLPAFSYGWRASGSHAAHPWRRARRSRRADALRSRSPRARRALTASRLRVMARRRRGPGPSAQRRRR
jgi:hypothetical protein